MGPEAPMLHFAKRDMNLKRKLVEQFEKYDVAFNENMAKISQTMEVIGNVMEQCVGILENMTQTLNPYNNFQGLNYLNAVWNLQNQSQYYKESANQNGPNYDI